MAVPKLRFKEFNTDYTNTTFEKLKGFSIQSGKSEEKGDTGEFPFYGSTGVIGYKDIFDYEGKSILIARVGANAGSLYQIDGKYSVSDNTLRLTVSDDTSLDYLRELLIKFNLNRLVFGTGQPLVTGGMIKKVNISIPEFTEQTKIASFLSNVDEKISQLTQKHQLLSQYKQGMMQKLFSQQLRFKADDGSEFGEWELGKLSDLAEIQGGFAFKSAEFGKGNSKVLRIGDIQKNIDLDKFNGVNSLEVPDSRYRVFKESIVMALSGATFGKLGKVQSGSAFINQRVATFVSKNNSMNDFLYQIMLSQDFYNYIQSIPSASAQPNISNQDVMNYELNIPSLAEQTKIANFLSAIDQKIEVVAQQIEQAKTWKKGLLQQMFV